MGRTGTSGMKSVCFVFLVGTFRVLIHNVYHSRIGPTSSFFLYGNAPGYIECDAFFNPSNSVDLLNKPVKSFVLFLFYFNSASMLLREMDL